MRNEEYENIQRELNTMEEQQKELEVEQARIFAQEEEIRFQNKQMAELLKDNAPHSGEDKELQRLWNEQIEMQEQQLSAQDRFVDEIKEEVIKMRKLYAGKVADYQEELQQFEEKDMSVEDR